MKKTKLILGVLATLFLVGCSKAPEAKQAKSNHIQYVLNTEEPVYWHTDADGTSKAKKINDGYQVSVPYRTTSFKLKLYSTKDMKDSASFTVNKAKPLADYETFVSNYNDVIDYMTDQDISTGNQSMRIETTGYDEGYHKILKSGATSIYANCNDGKLLGLRVVTLLNGTEDAGETHSAAIMAIPAALDGEYSNVVAAFSKSMKKQQRITTTSNSIKYQIDSKKDVITTCDIYK